MFKKILIANRGEIVLRLLAACQELGVATVVVYSTADAHAPWLRVADEAYPLPGDTATATYLNKEAILAIASRCGADAIHPGYGFLSENPHFASACADRDIVFIGPPPEAISRMGSKAAAREIARAAGVPIVPGVDGAGLSTEQLQTAVADIPFPVLVKASAGGGGKGMRVVWSADEFADAVQDARREAQSAFGNDHILVERYFTAVHHVEIQILADKHDTVLHLFERECSIQRRHQKIIEESPAPVIQDDNMRQEMAAAAVNLARSVGYTNAGTVEFIVDEEGQFYFLEMNTRLQVEHPVTELVTGLDLVVWQIRIAAGERLPFAQTDIDQRGHALECRLYAEDPAQGFLPSIGEIAFYQRPSGPHIRLDDGIETGSTITPFYDPMLAKLITWGRTRAAAIAKMRRALQQTIILGVTTNIPYLLDILVHPDFVAGRTPTHFLEENMADWQDNVKLDDAEWLAAAAFELLEGKQAIAPAPQAVGETVAGPWHEASRWRNVQSG